MKRYLVFAGANDYPLRGWGDFKKDFDDLELAKEFIKINERECLYDFRWSQIVDLETGKIIYESEI